MEQTRTDLIRHLGRAPTIVESALIDRAALLTVYVSLFDARALEAGGLSEPDTRRYLAYSNSLTRLLRALGMRASSTSSPQSLASLLADVASVQHDDADST